VKLIPDPWNGGRWQWRIYDASLGLWFDYGDSFPATPEGKREAEEWRKQERLEEEGKKA
jgi:hypothetical protein